MNKPVKRVVVVGGGTAGWITAGTIAAEHEAGSPSGIEVILIESPDVAAIGVGEGTWPTMRTTLHRLGLSENHFVRECDAAFKQGTRFSGWCTGATGDQYYHPFSLPQGYLRTNLAASWLSRSNRSSFADAVCVQSQLCDAGLAPRQFETPEYAFVANYGYHLDAGKFATLLQRHCTAQLGVKHVLDHVTAIQSSENGDIESVATKLNGNIRGDLFVDCTGFASLLLGKHYGIDFVSRQDTLFIDRALAVQVPYPEANSPVASQTISTAQDAGWIWDIGLSSRRGVGYVYSSAHCGDSEAEQALRAYVARDAGGVAESLPVRQIRINPGHRKKFWHRNCVAVGMAAGFLEPLEASALVLVELSAQMISEQLPATRDTMDIIARRFNDKFLYRWDRVIDFLKLHYVLTRRTDTEFWRDNVRAESVPDSLQELLTLWRRHVPWHGDFSQVDEVFSAASYQYVLYGMGFETQAGPRRSVNAVEAEKLFRENAAKTRQLLAALPTNRDLLNRIGANGSSVAHSI